MASLGKWYIFKPQPVFCWSNDWWPDDHIIPLHIISLPDSLSFSTPSQLFAMAWVQTYSLSLHACSLRNYSHICSGAERGVCVPSLHFETSRNPFTATKTQCLLGWTEAAAMSCQTFGPSSFALTRRPWLSRVSNSRFSQSHLEMLGTEFLHAEYVLYHWVTAIPQDFSCSISSLNSSGTPDCVISAIRKPIAS